MPSPGGSWKSFLGFSLCDPLGPCLGPLLLRVTVHFSPKGKVMEARHARTVVQGVPRRPRRSEDEVLELALKSYAGAFWVLRGLGSPKEGFRLRTIVLFSNRQRMFFVFVCMRWLQGHLPDAI